MNYTMANIWDIFICTKPCQTSSRHHPQFILLSTKSNTKPTETSGLVLRCHFRCINQRWQTRVLPSELSSGIKLSPMAHVLLFWKCLKGDSACPTWCRNTMYTPPKSQLYIPPCEILHHCVVVCSKYTSKTARARETLFAHIARVFAVYWCTYTPFH